MKRRIPPKFKRMQIFVFKKKEKLSMFVSKSRTDYTGGIRNVKDFFKLFRKM